MIINKIELVAYWCYWLFSRGLKFYWIYCSLKWMPEHAKEYSFDVIEFTMCTNESCSDEFEFHKTPMKVFKLNWMFTIMQISLWRVHFAQLMLIGVNEPIFAFLFDFKCKSLHVFSKWTAKDVISPHWTNIYHHWRSGTSIPHFQQSKLFLQSLCKVCVKNLERHWAIPFLKG